MTENEAISRIKDHMEIHRLKEPRAIYITVALSMAITAIKEIQQYREIGTVEECREAVEKQKAKELVYESDSVFSNGFSHYRMGKCPMCDRYYNSSDEVNYCSKCGQALADENLEGMKDGY